MSLFITKPTGHFIFIQFNVPFKIISAHMRRTNQWVPGLKREDPEKKKHMTHLQADLMPRVGTRTHIRHSGEIDEWLSVVMKYQLSHGDRRHFSA